MRLIGPLLGVYYWQGSIVDGRRRRMLCQEMGFEVHSVHVPTRRELGHLLWSVHPDRALALLKPETLADATHLFGVSPGTIAMEMKRLKPKGEPRKATMRSERVKGAIENYCSRVTQGLEPLDPGELWDAISRVG
jgi:hypothetical protein